MEEKGIGIISDGDSFTTKHKAASAVVKDEVADHSTTTTIV